MYASQFHSIRIASQQASTVATRRATKQDILEAKPSSRIDWHADRKTEQE